MPPAIPTITAAGKSSHYEQVKKAIPSWLSNASLARINALASVKLTAPDWHAKASPAARLRLQNATKLLWNAQNNVDRALTDLQNVHAFAKPLLQQALKDRFGIEDDVEQTWLRLYAPANSAWWVRNVLSATTSRTVSLLDAALHNFSRDETFTHDSEFISRPDAQGHFTVKPIKHRLSIKQFQSLCRELDLGARYEQHLKTFLQPDNPVASNVLRHQVILSQKTALNVAAQMALMTNDIDRAAADVIRDMLDDRHNVRWNGRPVSYHNLVMMDAALTGIVLISAQGSDTAAPTPVIAYVPHDPQHPLKQYPSALEFMNELTRQLRFEGDAGGYQRFFSQFVSQQQRGYFFAGLNDRLSKVKWHPAVPGSNLPSWRETPVEHPDLQFAVLSFRDDRQTRYNGDLWGYLYRQKLDKVFNDTREIAISTAYVDRMARWAWWDNLEKILSDILNVALLVVTPLVPGLGTLMLAYTAYQLTQNVVEGLVDLAEGRLAEAGEQVLGVLQNVVQLGAFAAAGSLGSLARTRLSAFFESLKPVRLNNGQARLWNPDLTPYQQNNLVLPTSAQPDELGLVSHQSKRLLRLDDRLFEVTQTPDGQQYRMHHPQRAEAYAPTLKHNGHGAWVSETENPRQWEGVTLMRRLGPTTDAFSDAQLQQLRQISGTDEAQLRRMHVENAPPPPLLADTLLRLAPNANPPTALSAPIASLFTDFADLPEPVAQRILDSATAAERQQIAKGQRLPLRLRNHARELQFEVSSVRAMQGLYHNALTNLDTERLVLGTLRIKSDTFGHLRLEIRQGTFDGELRCSAGPQNAPLVRILVRDDAGTYSVRDAKNHSLHQADNLYESILQALGTAQRRALGYQPGDAEHFKQWLMVKLEPPAERRTLLAEPPIRAIALPEHLQLVRGGGLSKDGDTLNLRIGDLHPHFNESEIDAFAEALRQTGDPYRAMEQQENRVDELRAVVNRWAFQQPETWGPGSNRFRDEGGLHIAEKLMDCFERKHTDLGSRTDLEHYSLDLSREMLPIDLETWWAKRPALKQFYDKVTVLKLDNTRFSTDPTGLLKDFPNLRELSAKGCDLQQLPEGIGKMHRLERLRLSENQIVLDASAVRQLKDLTYLEALRLDDNPLGSAPNIGRMPRLKVVTLSNTRITKWPEGCLDKPRPRGFFLDLRKNPLTSIPEVVLGSPQAMVVARTHLDVADLSVLNRVLYQRIRHSCGLPSAPRTYAISAADEMIRANFSTELWNEIPGWGIERQNLWSRLIDEPSAESFILFLIDTQNFADYRAGGEARNRLLQRVWRMLDAVHLDDRLREELFAAVEQPDNCGDAGAQRFNNMGIKVLASEAYSYSTDPAQLEKSLVTLAKGAARLDLVNDIAEADVASRGGDPDEVEVYLAYQTGLAQRLGLPWQSEGMLYRTVSGVTDTMIDQAYDTVLTLEQGDGLVNKMLERDFWEQFLCDKYPIRTAANKRLYLTLYEQLETLRETQLKWTESTADDERAVLREQLNVLMNDLPVPPTVVFAESPISNAMFDRLLVDLGDAEKELLRRLTREALSRAGQ